MSILEIKGLTHMFDNKMLFENSNLTINNGDHTGIVGLNGAGKSTFINIIGGNLIQDGGEIKWLNGIRRGYLDQHADIERNQTVMEYLQGSFTHLYELNTRMEKIYEEMGSSDPDELDKLINKSNNILDRLTHSGFFDLDATIKKVANGLGVNNFGYDTSVSTLSGGQRAKLMLSKLLLTQPDVMMLDEPTNFLDIEHIAWLSEYLNSFEGTYLVISHDTDFLDKVCKSIVNIENGSIKKYSGNYSSFFSQRQENAKQYEESYARQQKEIEKMEDYIARNKARAATAGMANSRKKMLDKMDVMRKPTTILDAEFDFPYTELHTREMLIVKNLEIGYDHVLLPPINMLLSGETKLWIRGTNGIGKSTLLKTLMGKLQPKSGSYHFHPAVKINYLEQDLEFRDFDINAVTYFSEMFPKYNQKQQRNALSKVGIKGDLALKPISDLSGGEQVRIRISTLMNVTSNILILDEPTNHLDVRAKEVLKQALCDYKGAIVLVSHEREFAESVCNDIFDCRG